MRANFAILHYQLTGFPDRSAHCSRGSHDQTLCYPSIGDQGTGPDQHRDHSDCGHHYTFNHAGTHAIVKGDYKIVREGKGNWALCDIAKKRTEITNVASRHPEVGSELAGLWEARWGKR